MAFTSVISQPGPLPIVATVPVTKPKQLLLVAGSVYSPVADGQPIGFRVLVDATVVGVCQIRGNSPAADNHMACVPSFIPLTLAPASSPFAVTLQPLPGTFADIDDLFQVTLVEED